MLSDLKAFETQDRAEREQAATEVAAAVAQLAKAELALKAAQAAMVRQLRAQLSLLEDNYAQCTEVRKALAGDLEDASRRLEQFAEQAKVSTGGGKWW